MTVVVSAYFKIPSKKPHSWYKYYLENFLKNINQTCYFYTSQDIKVEFSYLSNPNLNYIISKYPTSDFPEEFWERQICNDPEKYHTVSLIKLWYFKKEFVLRTIELLNLPEDTVYIWCDAGCVRDQISVNFLKDFGHRNFIKNDKLYVQQIQKVDAKLYYKFPIQSIAGAIMAGTKIAWKSYKIIYDKVLTEYDKAGVSGSSDQYITLSSINIFPDYFEICNYNNYPINEWFFFLALI
jgi:hypothetical protein